MWGGAVRVILEQERGGIRQCIDGVILYRVKVGDDSGVMAIFGYEVVPIWNGVQSGKMVVLDCSQQWYSTGGRSCVGVF